jgi:hypothetical protein
MTTQQPLHPINEPGRFVLTFHGDARQAVLNVLSLASPETFDALWAELTPHLPNESIRDLLLTIKEDEHEHSHMSAAIAKTLFERRDRQVVLEHVPYWRAEAARLIIEDPEASDGELHAAIRYAPDDLKPRAADLLYEFIECELPEADTLFGYRLKRWYADILVVPCSHREDAIRGFLAIPWDVQDEIDGQPTRIRMKDCEAAAILCRCTDANVLERIADHVLADSGQPMALLLHVAEHVPTRSDRAMERVAAWCDEELPPRLATRPIGRVTTLAWELNQWKGSPEYREIAHAARLLDGSARRVPSIGDPCRAIIVKHGLAPYATTF